MSPLVFLCLLFPCLLYGLKRFEAGTPAIGEAIGLGAAIDYLSCIGMEQIHEYEVLFCIFVSFFSESFVLQCFSSFLFGLFYHSRKSKEIFFLKRKESIIVMHSHFCFFCCPERVGDISLWKPSICSKCPNIWSGTFPNWSPCSFMLFQYWECSSYRHCRNSWSPGMLKFQQLGLYINMIFSKKNHSDSSCWSL